MRTQLISCWYRPGTFLKFYGVDMIDEIHCGNAIDVLKQLPDDSVDCCITSPPYWSLRSYDVDGQIGLEKDFHEYLRILLQVFSEVKRVLKKEGTLWINMGDSYASSGSQETRFWHGDNPGKHRLGGDGELSKGYSGRARTNEVAAKSLMLIPERFSIGMVDELGFILRNVLIWHKPNPMPSSAKDRFTNDFEYLYFFTKSKKYYFEQQFEPTVGIDLGNGTIQYPYRKMYTGRHKRGYENEDAKDSGAASWTPKERHYNPKGRNKRSVWNVATSGSQWEYCKHCDTFYNSRKRITKRVVVDRKTIKYCNKCNATDGWVGHFASFPEALIEIPVRAGCPEGGIVLDPFIGSGTTAIVAIRNRRRYIGIDINPDYVAIAKHRIKEVQLELCL